ncbi:tripartite tricarboxylate transporter TctB family protein [Marinomonas rhizomae]|uniref:tripartite tricarboxylate transporter TctB family protein n=1 Tax=Marinomonas rhizomae TaxID=491948 RepID=UPI002103EBE1|nr:tripartite tricarboxylate transporter TctB family protein [Marinomonas rhizomae]UTV98453.1 tripartite tricarboxylate transporter TctB family protein [Marinomonas rhizomae]
MSLERIVTGGILVFGLTFLFQVMPQQVETVSYGRIVPATLPTILLWIIVGASSIQLITLKDNVGFNGRVVLRTVVLLALMVATAWLMKLFAFEYVAPIFALLIMLFIGERRWYWLLLGGILIPLGVWLLVEQVLGRALS